MLNRDKISDVGLLRERDFRLLLIGQSVSYVGNAAVPVALAFAILDRTHSASDLGYVLAAESAAQVAFLLAGGVIADRVSRRFVMLGSDGARGVTEAVLGFLLVTGSPSIWAIGVLAVAQGIAGAMYFPASAAIVPAVVSADNLQRANQLQQIASAASTIAGPALAGLLVVTTSPGWVILLDAVSFLVSVGCLGAMRVGPMPGLDSHHFRFIADLREGWREFRRFNWLWPMVLGFMLFNLLSAAYTVLGPVASVRYYDGAASWATVATVGGVGSVAGGLAAVRFSPRHPLRVAVALATLDGFVPLAFAARSAVPVIALFAALAGTGGVLFSSLFNTTMQRQVPERSLSRVTSYSWFGATVVYPAGLALAGPVASVIGVRGALLGIGAVMIIVAIVLLSVPEVRSLTDAAPALTESELGSSA